MKIIPIEDVSADQIEEQITLREKELDSECVGALYGARNTWYRHKREAERLRSEIQQLKEMGEDNAV